MAKRAQSMAGPRELPGESAARLRADLVRFLLARAADPTLAEDLAQEALVHVLRGLPSFEGKAELRTWARRIALNVWRDHLRRRAASAAERTVGDETLSVLSVLDSIGPTTPAPAPEEAYDRRVTHQCLLVAARRLPLNEREVLLLHDFGLIPLERAAASLGCSVGAAKVRLHRARRRLARICREACASETTADGSILCTPEPVARRSVTRRRKVGRIRKTGKRRE